MQAADIMTVDVIAAAPNMTVREVAKIMIDRGVSALPVINEDAQIVGIISEGDLIRRAETGTEIKASWWLDLLTSAQTLQERFLKSHGMNVSDVMTHDPITVAPDTPIAEIATTLEQHRIKRVPVVADGKVIGIVSRANLLHALASVKIPQSPGTADDRALREAVWEIISNEPGLKSVLVNVTVSDGEVRLWGAVRSDTEEKALVVAARTVPGVKSVESNFARLPDLYYGYM